ncbi:UDP-Glc:alpha-D-GlcNAc-diphosphoundecaprenol beta-1,3-glucosyltransferase WfgD [Novipirellula aureliae]|uniref:UDP-Glc:alpha-D-GlcNAc-diphosphoundecaprenol beta-1,3-glucosyltransferase WfgD n=1 Tax=Novipirellula aureliae TaxID=2527966 RepID=A0A5C6E6X5_9BACT|nr:glycosyltransferase [Novipirellula aureliae]TWU44334.1 UDP-Glc:alpha-D-GlcNAc-diphosphoundecaprenol beta-1,3-glucosyltransferase WfgD [Novipirellula aureliae]
MDISVIICTWNRCDLLRQTLQAFGGLCVSADVEWELLVVDNASTDNTHEVVTEFQDLLPVRYVFETRQGKSNAANRAVRESSGKILAWTDDDALVSSDWLTQVLTVFEATQADIIYGRVEPWWETQSPAWFTEQMSGRFALLDHGDECRVMSPEEGYGYGVNYAFRRSVFKLIGPFAPDLGPNGGLGFGGEDTLLFRKAHEHQLRVVYSPDVLIKHFIPRERCNRSYFRRRQWRGSRDELRMMRLRHGAPKGMLGLPRYRYRQAFSDLIKLSKETLVGKYDKVFHLELRVIGFAGLFWNAVKSSCRGFFFFRKPVQDQSSQGPSGLDEREH